MNTEIRNLMFDRAKGIEIFDEETNRVISNVEADEKIREAMFSKLGLTKDSSAKKIKRALKSDAAVEVFEIIEQILDLKIATGLHDNEFFNAYVETANLADGDENEFWADKDIILNVAKVSGSHHDLIMQTLAEGEPYSVPTSYYAVKVGTDIRLFLTGKKNWSDFINAAARAFIVMIQQEVYTEFMGAAAKIPASSQFVKTGQLNSTTKPTFDTLIEDVQTVNDGAPVTIIGTKTALRKLTGLADINWIAASQKEAVANTGIIGTYEGIDIMEIPQRFANNDTATKLMDNTKLLIMPQVEDKFVKFVDYGETELEVTEIGATMNDQQSYELQRRMGVGTLISRYFGEWTIQ